MKSGFRRQGGIALVLVMWVITLLTVMALSLTLSQRTESALSDDHIAAARFRALADAAIAFTALQFTATTTADADQTDADQEETEHLWLPDGTPHPWRFAGIDLIISVSNESSRIDLDEADQALLSKLLQVSGVEDDQATALAAAILDWRDEDDLTTLDGAEDADYRAAGRVIGAKDEPFSAVEELRQVLGMTDEIYRRLAPEVTVDANGEALEEAFASPTVLAATQGITLQEAAERVAERNQPRVPGAEPARPLSRGGPFYRIRVIQDQGRPLSRMEALIELTPAEDSPYRVLWRRFGLLGEATPVPHQGQG